LNSRRASRPNQVSNITTMIFVDERKRKTHDNEEWKKEEYLEDHEQSSNWYISFIYSKVFGQNHKYNTF